MPANLLRRCWGPIDGSAAHRHAAGGLGTGERPASASALSGELPVSRQAISKHLEVLTAAGLVASESQGREVVYRARGGRLSEVAHRLEQIGAVWDRRLLSIKHLAEEADRS